MSTDRDETTWPQPRRHDIPRPADPFHGIPNSDDEYAGTELGLRDSDPATGEGPE